MPLPGNRHIEITVAPHARTLGQGVEHHGREHILRFFLLHQRVKQGHILLHRAATGAQQFIAPLRGVHSRAVRHLSQPGSGVIQFLPGHAGGVCRQHAAHGKALHLVAQPGRGVANLLQIGLGGQLAGGAALHELHAQHQGLGQILAPGVVPAGQAGKLGFII